jgi:phosphoribosylformimino-5-aminoimidazole carboxamide ribotide isomerase
MQVIPAIDVLGGKVVRLLRGDFDDVTAYARSPAVAARRWAAGGAELVHVVDLEGARSGRVSSGLMSTLAGFGMPFQVGGGIRDPESAVTAIAAGAERVVVGTAALGPPGDLGDIVAAVGELRVIVALDVADGRARGSGWLDGGLDLTSALHRVVESGVRRVLTTGIATDGTMEGPDHALFDRVRREAPELEIIASGGVGRIADVTRLRDSGAAAVIIGKALYEGRFTLGEALRAAG